MTLPALPPEIWLNILRHVPATTLHAISQTCHTLYNLATSEQLFRHYTTSHFNVPSQVPNTHTWQEIHSRANKLRETPIYECFTSPTSIIPLTDVADSLLVHVPDTATLTAFPYKWSLPLGFLRGEPGSAVALADFRAAFVDSVIESPKIHLVDVRDGTLVSYPLPNHPAELAPIPGREELLLPAKNFSCLLYYPGVLRVFDIHTGDTFDLPETEHLLLGESPKPLIEGYALSKGAVVEVYNLDRELLTELPLEPYDSVLTIATNGEFSSFTARILREAAVVALTRSGGCDWWTHLHRRDGDQKNVHMFYNGTKTLLLPAPSSPRMTIIETGEMGGLNTIRAARVRGAPFDWGALSYGGDVVLLCARRVGVVSLFDINTSVCIRSLRFFRGRVEGVAFIGGAWVVGWRNEQHSVFEAWRFGKVPQMFGNLNHALQQVDDDGAFIGSMSD